MSLPVFVLRVMLLLYMYTRLQRTALEREGRTQKRATGAARAPRAWLTNAVHPGDSITVVSG